MKKKSIGVNAVLNLMRSALSVLFPLVTYPYAVRILHVDGIGKVNYAESIVSYFALIAVLGISTYAIREGAKVREDKQKFTVFTNEVFTINIVSTAIAFLLLCICLVVVQKFHTYTILILISSLSMILTTIGVDWINTIYEDFLFVTVRSIISNLVSLALLFLLVHNEKDLYFYALLTVITNAITCISNLFYCQKYVKIHITKVKKIGYHLKPMLTLFANNLAISIYVNADTTMLGWMLGDYYVGLYAVAVKIYKITKSILVAIYSVTIPRLSNFAGKGDKEAFQKLYTDLLNYLTLLLLPAGVGLIAVSREIILIIGGPEYLEATVTLKILGVSIIFAILGGAFTSCLNIPLGREKYNMHATILSAIINILLNLVFIPLFHQDGAAITTAISEFIVFVFCFVSFPNKKAYINFKSWSCTFAQALLGSALILLCSVVIKQFISGTFLRLVVIVPFTMLLYVLQLSIFRNPYLFRVFNVIRDKVKKK